MQDVLVAEIYQEVSICIALCIISMKTEVKLQLFPATQKIYVADK